MNESGNILTQSILWCSSYIWPEYTSLLFKLNKCLSNFIIYMFYCIKILIINYFLMIIIFFYLDLIKIKINMNKI